MAKYRNSLLGKLAVFVAALLCAPILQAQTSAPVAAAPPAAATPAAGRTQGVEARVHLPDLSGDWTIAAGGRSLDPDDPNGNKPEELPMTAWGREQLKNAKPPFGAAETFDTNDPVQKFCDPPGATRLYQYPWQFTLVQTPTHVYVLFEYLHVWRVVTMNHPHAKDLDATWLGDSVGKYEGDALVIDTIGFNDKTWLDNSGHPHSDALHLVERFRRPSHDSLQLALTIDDPKAYTKPFTAMRTFKLSAFPMGETMCSLSEDQAFQKSVMDQTLGSQPAKK